MHFIFPPKKNIWHLVTKWQIKQRIYPKSCSLYIGLPLLLWAPFNPLNLAIGIRHTASSSIHFKVVNYENNSKLVILQKLFLKFSYTYPMDRDRMAKVVQITYIHTYSYIIEDQICTKKSSPFWNLCLLGFAKKKIIWPNKHDIICFIVPKHCVAKERKYLAATEIQFFVCL